MVWARKDLKDHLIPTPHHGKGHLPVDQVVQTPSNLPLITSRDGAFTAPLRNLFQCLTSLTVKNFSLTSNLFLPSFGLKPLSLVLRLDASVKSSEALMFEQGPAVQPLAEHFVPWGQQVCVSKAVPPLVAPRSRVPKSYYTYHCIKPFQHDFLPQRALCLAIHTAEAWSIPTPDPELTGTWYSFP